jgi:hypothetical protein
MKKEKIVILVLGFLLIAITPISRYICSKHMTATYDAMNFLIQSENNLEAVQNIKLLEALKENKNDEAIKFMEVRVKSSLARDGVNESTITKAKQYQSSYCQLDCLGITK